MFYKKKKKKYKCFASFAKIFIFFSQNIKYEYFYIHINK